MIEIDALAKACGLPGFRYRAFPPVPLDLPPLRPAKPEPQIVMVARAPVPFIVPVPAPVETVRQAPVPAPPAPPAPLRAEPVLVRRQPPPVRAEPKLVVVPVAPPVAEPPPPVVSLPEAVPAPRPRAAPGAYPILEEVAAVIEATAPADRAPVPPAAPPVLSPSARRPPRPAGRAATPTIRRV